MPYAESLRQLIGRGVDAAAAINAPGRRPLTYGGLRDLVDMTAGRLEAVGVRPGDTVAVVLENGPELATAFIAIGATTTIAPLNPAYRREEFEFFLGDLGARVLVIEKGTDSPARVAAERLGIRVTELEAPTDEPAGVFRLGDAPMPPRPHAATAGNDDVALVLHTSGTTSRPKIVPLSHRNVCASAEHIVASLQLTADDRCLNIMPLFHIHGLMAAVLASLAAGGSVWCAPGFNALSFFRWMEEARPTWFTAVPSMHQAIAARASRHRDTLANSRLRFVRSSSSRLSPQLMEAMEALFAVPVVEAYGMTEAAHQMASNPLPPGRRTPGTVGVAAGPEIAVMDAAGTLLEPGNRGEIVIRGPNVITGYQGNAEATLAAFSHGWFRTGDEGTIDEDGYLRLTGRLKEIINRGGEKISPQEIDEVLLDHPAVSQAVAFAVPHPALGEDVAVAIVLAPSATASELDIRQYVSGRLADFKVPRRVVFVDEIPKGPTRKIQRIGLAATLGLARSSSDAVVS